MSSGGRRLGKAAVVSLAWARTRPISAYTDKRIFRRITRCLTPSAILAAPNGARELDPMNRLLQDLAWDAVIHHPLSGVKAKKTGTDLG